MSKFLTSLFSVVSSHTNCIVVLGLVMIMSLSSACEASALEDMVGGNKEPTYTFDTIAIDYPNTLRDESVRDHYFGYPVADPYRWLEPDTAIQVQQWEAAQQAATEQYLSQVPFRTAIAKRLQRLQNYRRSGLPHFHGGYYYYLYNNGSWATDALVLAADLKDSITIVLNPNTWDAGPAYSLGRYAFSADSRYLAYEQRAKEEDRSVIRVVDLLERVSLPEVLEVQGLTTLTWGKDGFFYTSFPKGSSSEPLLFHRLYFHRLGGPQQSDELVFTDYHHPERRITAHTDTASQCLILEVYGDGVGNAVYFRSLASDDPSFTPIVESLDFRFEWVGGTANHLYFITDLEADLGRLIKVSIVQPNSGFWEDHITQGTDEMLSGWRIGHHWVVNYLRDAAHQVLLYDSLGQQVRRMHFPEPGSFTGVAAGKNTKELFFGFSSFLRPETIYRLDLERYRSALVYSPALVFSEERYQQSLQWVSSYDDTNLPIYFVHRRDLDLSVPHPTLLVGAAAVGEPLVPEWNLGGHWMIPAAIEQGVVVAVANLRGSSGFGRRWKQQGLRRKYQTRLDDLQAVAEYLQKEPFVASDRLAIYGAGQGGTILMASINQRPDLFTVAIAEDGWYDLLRYQNFRTSVPLLPVFGSSKDSLETDHLLSYSPLHNVVPNKFPAMLLSLDEATAAGVPLHSRKLVAELQYQQRGYDPILLYTAKTEQLNEPIRVDPWDVAALSFLFYQTQTFWK